MNLNLGKVKIKYITHNGGFESRTISEFNDAMFYKKRKGFFLDETFANYIVDVWQTINSNNPQQLINLIEESSNWHSLINHKLQSLFLLFPDKDKGISPWEYRILSKCKTEESTSINYILGHVLGAFEDSFGYEWLENMMYKLSNYGSFNNPLLVINKNQSYVKLTDLGRKIRDNKANNFDFNTYKRQVLAVNLDSNSKSIWCYNSQTSWLENHRF